MNLIKRYKEQKKEFWKESGLNPKRTLEEEYVHSVNSLVAENRDIKCIYNHQNYVDCSKEMYESKFGEQESDRESEDIVFLTITLGIIISSVIGFISRGI